MTVSRKLSSCGRAWPIIVEPAEFERSVTLWSRLTSVFGRVVSALNRPRHENVDGLSPRLKADIGLLEDYSKYGPKSSNDGRVDPFLLGSMYTIAVLLVAPMSMNYAISRAAAESALEHHAPLLPRDVSPPVRATGTVEPTRLIVISSEQSGILQSILVDFDQRVVAGQVLAELAPDKFLAKVTRARAKLTAASARLRDGEATMLEKRRSWSAG